MRMILAILILVISTSVFSQEKELLVPSQWEKAREIDSWQLVYAIYGTPGNGLGGLRGLATAVFPRSFKAKLDCTETAPGLNELANAPGHNAMVIWSCMPVYKAVVRNIHIPQAESSKS